MSEQPNERVATDEWDEVVKVGVVSSGGQLRVGSLMAGPPDLPALTAAGPNPYRVRDVRSIDIATVRSRAATSGERNRLRTDRLIAVVHSNRIQVRRGLLSPLIESTDSLASNGLTYWNIASTAVHMRRRRCNGSRR